jgi:cell division protein FtsN
MNTRIASVISVALCALLASCYPYDEGANRKKTKKSSTTAAAAEAEKKAEEQKLKEQQVAQTTSTDGSVITETTDSSIKPSDSPATSPTTNPTVKPTTAVKKPEYSYASKVPGKEGFVFSPYNNKVVDVRDIPSGTLVQDPTYPASEKKYFRVP